MTAPPKRSRLAAIHIPQVRSWVFVCDSSFLLGSVVARGAVETLILAACLPGLSTVHFRASAYALDKFLHAQQ